MFTRKHEAVAAGSHNAVCGNRMRENNNIIYTQTKKAKPENRFDFQLVAEREGFEPPVPCSTPVFKTGAIDHSAISPGVTQQGIEPWTHRLRVCCSTS